MYSLEEIRKCLKVLNEMAPSELMRAFGNEAFGRNPAAVIMLKYTPEEINERLRTYRHDSRIQGLSFELESMLRDGYSDNEIRDALEYALQCKNNPEGEWNDEMIEEHFNFDKTGENDGE